MTDRLFLSMNSSGCWPDTCNKVYVYVRIRLLFRHAIHTQFSKQSYSDADRSSASDTSARLNYMAIVSLYSGSISVHLLQNRSPNLKF